MAVMKELGFKCLMIRSCSKGSNPFHGDGRMLDSFSSQNLIQFSGFDSIWLGKSFNLN